MGRVLAEEGLYFLLFRRHNAVNDRAVLSLYVLLKSNHTKIFLFFVFIWFQAPWNLTQLGKAEIGDSAITIVTLIKRELSNEILEHF